MTGKLSNLFHRRETIDLGIVVCSLDDAIEDNRQRVHLIPVDADGMVRGIDGRVWKFNGEKIIANARKYPVKYPGDYFHASIHAPKTGAQAPACGWIDPASLEVNEQGLWGEVEWTERAANAIRGKEYRYLSPVFLADRKTNETVAFKGFGLTHYPNLGSLEPVANQQEDDTMEELLERLRRILNLPELATAEDVIAELEKAISLLRGAAGEAQANAQVSALAEAVVAAIEANAQGETVDLADYVPRGEFDRLRAELNEVLSERENARVEAAVNEALEKGVIAPASRDWAENYCRKDPEGFADFVANAAKVVPLGEEVNGQQAPASGDALSAEEVAICEQLGISREDYLKTKKGKEE